jgi:hypothetical protein
MKRKGAHRLPFEHLKPLADGKELAGMASRVERHLNLSTQEREAGGEGVFRDLARFTAHTLSARLAK